MVLGDDGDDGICMGVCLAVSLARICSRLFVPSAKPDGLCMESCVVLGVIGLGTNPLCKMLCVGEVVCAMPSCVTGDGAMLLTRSWVVELAARAAEYGWLVQNSITIMLLI